ncbi:MAG: patatin-like phospholipase family protein [Nitrospira sp.]|nr:patatin-like phospholipase family protein [Nitrospira sp.]
MSVRSIILTLVLLWVGGCATALPKPATLPVSSPTHANQTLDQEGQRDGRFIGLALSGGGSRAAVFGGAMLRELHRLGLLQQVDVLSAVSGGALPAAYYALDGYRDVDFSNGFLERMGHDFQSDMRGRFVSPGNLLKYWFTSAAKSDTVVQVLDEQLFHNATFADLNPDRPKLLLNATDALTGEPFVISDESFAGLASPLSSFGVARAVYMSAAYPGVFNPVPLYGNASSSGSTIRPTVLAYDGGPVDNLGVKTLVNLLRNADQGAPIAARFPEGCLIISVDATPRIAGEQDQPLSASTVLLKSQRREVLEGVGIVAAQQDRAMFSTFTVNGSQSVCTFWHLALRQLPDADPLGARVTRIKTSFGLEATDQDALIRAAHQLIEQGIKISRETEIGPAFLREVGSPANTGR